MAEGVHDGQVVAEFAGETAVGILERAEFLQQGPDAGLPPGMAAAVPFFVVEVVQQGVEALRLAADAVDRLYEVAFVVHYLVEESCW